MHPPFSCAAVTPLPLLDRCILVFVPFTMASREHSIQGVKNGYAANSVAPGLQIGELHLGELVVCRLISNTKKILHGQKTRTDMQGLVASNLILLTLLARVDPHLPKKT